MIKKYNASHKLSTIIDHNPLILMAMSRFGISLGFGDKTINKICQEQNVDCATFLAIANFISFDECSTEPISPTALIDYLDSAHSYFLDFCLPMIRRKLIDAIGLTSRNELSLLILRYYDEYVEEVHKHMEYESNYVFKYVKDLLQGYKNPDYNIDAFASQHHGIHDHLKELKDILVRYLPQKDSNMLNVVLFDIINCEQDLMLHCQVEDRIFVPTVRNLEKELRANAKQPLELPDKESQTKEELISEREKDIIQCVALGLSNKEIADQLCISINTVTTHRRNIAQKLHIHSPAALTIYAVINGILNLDDLERKG